MNKLDKSKQVTTCVFDYEALTPEQRNLVMQRTGEIQERLQRSAQDIWEIGQRLADVRAQLKHGQLDAWLKAEFNWSRRTAYNFINVYETFGERANLAQLDIASSALYLLAAPSTPQKVREEYLLKAKEGEKITHKELSSDIKQKKQKSNSLEVKLEDDTPVAKTQLPTATSIPEILQLIPPTSTVIDVESIEIKEPEPKLPLPKPISEIKIEAGWYVLEGQHLIYCGDTAAPEFHSHIPYVNLAVAVTSDYWDHDWLIEQAKTLIVSQESALKQNKLEQLIDVFSQPGDAIVFPWLPYPEMIAIANKFNRKVIGGDVSQERCQKAILASGLEFASVKL
ncbi:MAG: DUF3102 domain-containing protein [Cyanobacteria bacterium P01_C01_bin.38]